MDLVEDATLTTCREQLEVVYDPIDFWEYDTSDPSVAGCSGLAQP